MEDSPRSHFEPGATATSVERGIGQTGNHMQHNQHGEHKSESHYLRLAAMIVLSFISMYVLMYAMVNTF